MSHDKLQAEWRRCLWEALVEIAEQGAVPEARPGPNGLTASEARTALGRGQAVLPSRGLVDALTLPAAFEPSFRVTVPIRNRADALFGLDFQLANGTGFWRARLLRVLRVEEADFADVFARVAGRSRDVAVPPPLPAGPRGLDTPVRLGVTDAAAVRSRVAGVPFAPAGFEWPRRESGRPLAFLAQLELHDGMLAFFYDVETLSEEDDAWRVVFWPASEALSVTQPPTDLEPVALAPQQGLEASEEDAVAQVLGDPDAIQVDPRRAGEVLLLQLDGDPLDVDLYDSGRLYFLISPQDLAARRFDRVRMELQSY